MLIGAMNHPEEDVLAEIAWMASMGLAFLDLTIEPPAAAADVVDPKAIRAALDQHGMAVVGHTAYYLPLGSPFEAVRRAAVEEVRRCLVVFAEVGVTWANVHPSHRAPFQSHPTCVKRNLQSFRELIAEGRKLGVNLMVENIPGEFNDVGQMAALLEPLPELGLHLDIGHCNLRVTQNTTEDLIRTYGHRLKHVHLHDNKGGNLDLHLPLGTGTVDYPRHIRQLKQAGYDGTITLEVFAKDRHHLAYSRDALRRGWEEA